jgi:hypothetical protein
MPEANLGIEKCIKGTKERNGTILCIEVDYAFTYNHLPMPIQLFKFITSNQTAGIIRE